jgi:hypothetical protein
MHKLSNERDRTHIVRSATPTPPMDLLYIACGHKGVRSGGFFRGGLPMRCPACNQKGKA